MNGNSQNNYRAGWNNMPSTGFSPGQFPHVSGPRAFADNRHIPHQLPTYYTDNRHIPHQTPTYYPDKRHIPHQVPAHYVDNRNLPHQVPAHYVDNRNLPHQTPPDIRHLPHPMLTHYADNRHLPHSNPTHYADNRHLPHPMQAAHYADNMHLPHQMPAQYPDKRHLPHQTVEHCTDNKNLPHQTPVDHPDKRHLPHQMVEHCTDKKNLPHQTPAHYPDKRHLPHQTVEHCTDNKNLPHQTPAHYPDKRHLPHQTVEHCTDNKHLPHQTPHYEDKMCLPHQMPKDLADKMHLPNQNPEDCAANKCLPHKTPDHNADKRKLPQQTSEANADKRQLPQQTSEANADKRQLPQQTSEAYANKRQLPHQKSEHCADKNLSQQTPKDFVDKKCLPQRTPEDCANKKCLPQQTPEDCADKKCLPPHVHCEICDLTMSPKSMESHNKGKKHQRRLLELHEQSMKRKASNGVEIRHNRSSQTSKEAYVDNKCLPHRMSKHCAAKKNLTQQTSEVYADKKCLPQQTPKDFANKMPLPHKKPEAYADNKCLPHQMSEHYADKNTSQQAPKDYANRKCLPSIIRCEICDVQFNPKCLDGHNNGKKHQRMLLELHEESMKDKTSNGEEIRHIQSSQINSVVQPKKVPADVSKRKHGEHTSAKDSDFKVENVKNETSNFKKKKVPAEMSKRKVRDNTDAKDHGFKHEIEGATGGKFIKMNDGIRRFVKSSKIAPVLAERSSFELQSQHVPASLSQESKGKKHHKLQSTTVEKNDQPQPTPIKLKASTSSNIIAKTEYISSDFAATVTPQGPVAAVGSSFEPKNHIDLLREVKEAKEHNGVQKRGVETNDKPQALGCCNISTMGEDKFSGSGAIVIALPVPQGLMTSQVLTPSPAAGSSFEPPIQINSPIKVEGAKEHNGVQKRGVETNDKPQALGCCNISTMGEDKFSGSGAIVIALPVPQGLMTSQVLTPSPAAGSSFEPPIQINSSIKVEGTELHEVQNHSVETNDQPRSISMEFHATAGSDINTLIEGACSDSGAVVIASPVAVIQNGMSDSNNETQNHIVDSNNQQRSISMELHNAAGSMTNNQTKVVNFDSTATEMHIEPLASLLPDAVGSRFEPVTEHGLDTETEPHMSEAILYTESQHHAEETDIEMLPPALMEIDVALEVSAETKTEGGSSQAEMTMDVDLSPESGKTKLLKVSVCLTCGDKGFEEAIVYCSKCGDYAMHRYCLAGPVVYTDEVTWFCVDCEEIVIEADHPNSETPESEKDKVVFDPQPIADPIWRGSLQVFNKSFDKISGLMGHLSTLACPKAFEESRHLPDVLYANLLQRSAVWPESFKKFGTNNQSIGLYFFPANESVERYYDQLVDEMISKDLAIRVMVEKTELLIFPSTLLPRQYKRFHSKYYLWGTFKGKQGPSSTKDT